MSGIPPDQEDRYMDNFRRKPPMEGFSRPGQLGGEAFDNDEVEGHIMDERDDIQGESATRRRLDEDTEGHLTRTSRGVADEDDTEGHKLTTRGVADEDDTEGHKLTTRGIADEDDTEGHKLTTRGVADEDDTEGHTLTKRS
jgi:hypothetical protein